MAARKKSQSNRPTATAAAKVDLFKTKDIKEDVLINRVIAQAGVTNDAETTGFIKAVLPRFAESSPRQAFSSMSKMVKEFGRGSMGRANAGGSSNGSNGSDGERTAAAAPAERRRPGRPPGSRNKAKPGGGSSNDKGQAANEKRKPGRPRKVDRPQS